MATAGGRARGKGKRGERHARDLLRLLGFHAERQSQYRGGQLEGSDVKAEGYGLHLALESKWDKKVTVWNAMEQAVRDAKGFEIPLVYMRRNNTPPIVALRADGFVKLFTAILKARPPVRKRGWNGKPPR